MEVLSREYGWLPSQIREEKYEDIIDYFDIISIRKLMEKAKSKYGR